MNTFFSLFENVSFNFDIDSFHLLSLLATHVPGQLNLGTEFLIRHGPLVREWRLHHKVLEQISDWFDRVNIHLFTS